MVAMNLKREFYGTRGDNTLYEIKVPDRRIFCPGYCDKETVTKGMIEKYYAPEEISQEFSMEDLKRTHKKKWKEGKIDNFAVIDTETNWNDEVMSIGVVVADVETKGK